MHPINKIYTLQSYAYGKYVRNNSMKAPSSSGNSPPVSVFNK